MTQDLREALTDEQEQRFEAIKQECKEADPNLPEPTDKQVMDSLLDTWDAVNDGLYTKQVEEALEQQVEEWREKRKTFEERQREYSESKYTEGVIDTINALSVDIEELLQESENE